MPLTDYPCGYSGVLQHQGRLVRLEIGGEDSRRIDQARKSLSQTFEKGGIDETLKQSDTLRRMDPSITIVISPK